MNSAVTTLKIIRDFVKESNLEFLACDIGNDLPVEGKSLEKGKKDWSKGRLHSDDQPPAHDLRLLRPPHRTRHLHGVPGRHRLERAHGRVARHPAPRPDQRRGL